MATHQTAPWPQDLAGGDRHTAQCIGPRIQRLGSGKAEKWADPSQSQQRPLPTKLSHACSGCCAGMDKDRVLTRQDMKSQTVYRTDSSIKVHFQWPAP